MAEQRGLDSWGELYVGFNRDRARLRRVLGARADGVWENSYTAMRNTPDYYQSSDAEVACAVMRYLMAFFDARGLPK